MKRICHCLDNGCLISVVNRTASVVKFVDCSRSKKYFLFDFKYFYSNFGKTFLQWCKLPLVRFKYNVFLNGLS